MWRILACLVLVGVSSASCSGCGGEIQTTRLPIALLNEVYSYQLAVELDWDVTDYSVEQTDGDLPSGLEVDEDGEISGTPREVGLFSFEVTLYVVDSDDPIDSTESYADSADLQIFVTEANTNNSCPSPDDETIDELYVCGGEVSIQLADQDSVDFDVNYYVNPDVGSALDATSLVLNITYDAALLSLDPEELSSAILREAASEVDATISFDTATAGTLMVTLESGEGQFFRRAGRLFDLPFHVVSTAPEGEIDVVLTLESVGAEEPTSLPETIALDGTITIEL